MSWQLLRDLPGEERRLVLSRTRRRHFARGEILFHEGDPAETMHFLDEGRVMARLTTPSGESVAFRVLGPGRVLGDVAVVAADRRRSATVVALEPTVTLSLTFADFDALCRDHPAIQRGVSTLLAARVRRLSEHLSEALFLPAEARIVRRLVDLAEEYGSGPGADRVVIPLSQTEVAELAGAARPTTNRVLRALEAAGVVALHRGRVEVTDRDALRARRG